MTNPLLGQPTKDSTAGVRFGAITISDTGQLVLSVDGAQQASRWSQEYVPNYGDTVAFVVIRDAMGQSSNLVLGRVSDIPATRPDEGVVTAVTGQILTLTAGGTTVQAKIATVATPVVGDRMLLEYRGTQTYAIAKVVATAAPVLPTPVIPLPPPGQFTRGITRFASTVSRTAQVSGGWSAKDADAVIQGTYNGVTYAGSWFYGTGPSSLSTVPLIAFRVWIPPRVRVGNFGAPVTLKLYAHTETQPFETEPVRVGSSVDLFVDAGWPGGWYPVPTSFATQIIAGGGLSIAGPTYGGVVGRDTDPMSGAIEITWGS